MKSSFVAVALSLFAGAALASPADASTAMLDDRQMKAIHILHSNKAALGLTREETEKFDKFMTSMRKRTPQGLLGALGALGNLGDLGGKKEPKNPESSVAPAVPSATPAGVDSEENPVPTPTAAADPSATPAPPKKGGILGGAVLSGLV
ncbi:hypothetical protein MGU_11446 [Metarhizium guizhouense ARSEF 977]|uniref:Uncharacterized protein n=1 Tax=Metarhizium guizhouense (strain ARSEF 977) TaxID=1276136 RepID=A0A0B4GUK7_METGA|nr:hypothetical protein MGU_11446 [Metarhizium guizhouense ARSEF 977]